MSKYLHGRSWHVALGVLMGYESIAMVSGHRIPTITRLNKRSHHVLGSAILAIFALHFLTTPEERP